jgi:uncharacterized protein with NRDE domain
MCLAIVAIAAHPKYRLVVAANRDEYHSREAVAATWWPRGILAGMDRVAGGTWFGVTGAGRWSLITNFREAVARDPAAPSRGGIVTEALLDTAAPLPCAASIALDGARFHGFNLLIGDADGAAYVSNRASGAVALSAGIYGLSNHLLDTPWPKVRRAKAGIERWLDNRGATRENVFALLRDEQQAAGAELPATGLSLQRERMLSSVFITSPDYGTRCSTVLTIDSDGIAAFAERSFDAEGAMTSDIAYTFPTR